jgi:hypothetical protein
MISLAEAFVMLACLVLPAVAGVILVDRTGYNRWLGLLFLVPLANLGLLLFLLVNPWPVQRELAVRRLQVGAGNTSDAATAYREATRLQRDGRHSEAQVIFGLIESRFPDTALARDAAIARAESAVRVGPQAAGKK